MAEQGDAGNAGKTGCFDFHGLSSRRSCSLTFGKKAMTRYFLVFVLGLVIGGTIAGIYGMTAASKQFLVGTNTGIAAAQFQIMKAIREKLGSDYAETDGYDPFFEVKADAVVVVERNGVKTLRIYAPSQKNK